LALKLKQNKITPSLGRVEKQFDTLPKKAFQFWRKTTPKRSGNARRKTSLKGDIITAKYPYAKRLDNGWSRKAPDGMSEPTFDYIEKISKGIIRKK